MTEKLARRGLRVRTEFEVDHLRSSRRSRLGPRTTVGEARALIARGRYGAYPIGDDSRCVEIVTRVGLLRVLAGENQPLLDHAKRDVVSVTPDDLAVTVLRRMLEEGIDHILVIAGGRLVGIVTRTDLIRTRVHQLEHEQRQTAWRLPKTIARSGDGQP